MALSDGLLQLWQATLLLDSREKNLVYNLFDRSMEQQWQNSNQVHKNIPDFDHDSTPTPDTGISITTDTDRIAAWATATRADADKVTLQLSGYAKGAVEIPEVDMRELSYDVRGVWRDELFRELRHDADTKMFAGAMAAAQKLGTTLGTSGTAFIARTGSYEESGGKDLMLAAVDVWSLYAYRQDLIDGEGINQSPFMICPPELVKALRKEMLDKGLAFDEVTRQILSQNTGIARPGLGFVGNLFGVDIYSWNQLALPEAGSEWTIYCGTPQAYSVALRPALIQELDVTENQVSEEPSVLVRANLPYAMVELKDDWHKTINIHEV